MLMRLFRRELDMYYDSSVGSVNQDIDRIMSTTTRIETLDQIKPKTE